MGERRTVQIYQPKKERENARVSKGSLFVLSIVRAIVVFVVVEAWWWSLTSVFEIQLNQRYFHLLLFLFTIAGICICAGRTAKYTIPLAVLAGGLVVWRNRSIIPNVLNHFANAWIEVRYAGEARIELYEEAGVTPMHTLGAIMVLTVPMVLIWILVLKSGRGKAIAIVLMLVPILCASSAGEIPAVSACWIQVLAAGIYLALISAGTGRIALQRGGFAPAVCVVVMAISILLGRGLEVGKKVEDSDYKRIRAVLTDNIEARMREWEDNKEQDSKEQDSKEQDSKEISRQEEMEREIENVIPPTAEELQRWQAMEALGQNDYSESSMDNLNRIAEYSPRTDMPGITVRVMGKPDKTVYYSERYGGEYIDGSWTETTEEEAESPQYSQYPQTLTRLIELCQTPHAATMQEAETFIRHQFEQNTIYDFKPGPTPAGKDFAEYFLFDNKKGFCVHFATTATLLYRIQGYQARYAEGFAIPASAFTLRENGVYEATITGDMGHAWCEVYENGWQTREHTLAYTGDAAPELRPAADSQKAGNIANNKKIVHGVFIICIVIGIGVALLYAQYLLRRVKKHHSFHVMAEGRGFQRMYQNIYDLGVYQGLEQVEPLSEESFEKLAHLYSFVPSEEWEWIKASVLSSMFYERIPQKADNKRMYRVYRSISEHVRGELKGIEKIAYRYLRCLD